MMIRITAASLLVAIVVLPNACAQDVYELQLFGADGGGMATAVYSSDEEGTCWFAVGDFSYASTTTLDGSWFGFSFGPITTRFAMGSVDDDFVFLKSLAFGDMLLGGALELTDGVGERFFVAGSRTEQSLPESEADELPPDGIFEETDPAVGEAEDPAPDGEPESEPPEAESDSPAGDVPEEGEASEPLPEPADVADAIESLIDGS